jgi:diguanylate cyclase (GGDEF)-like protein
MPMSDAAPERLALLADLLARYPGCGVGVLDASWTMGDAHRVLADAGLSIGPDQVLQAGALAEFVTTPDAWLVSDAAMDASRTGVATRTVRLRDGKTADLHLVEFGGFDMKTVVVLVPEVGNVIATRPPPTAIPASPRGGELHCDAFGVIISATPSALALLQRADDPIDGLPAIILMHPDDQEAGIVNWAAAKDQRGVPLRSRMRLVRSDGSHLWVELTMTNEIDASGEGDVRIEVYDISVEVGVTEALTAERELIGLLTETLPVGVSKFDPAGHIEYANERLTQLLSPRDPQEVFTAAAHGKLEDVGLATAFEDLLHRGTAGLVVADHRRIDGTLVHLEWTFRPVSDGRGAVTGGVVCVADVTEAFQLRAALEYRATTDALTGCLNRAGTIAALEHELATIGPAEGVGLLFLDLDRFKQVNDTEGHAIGDAVLEVVAHRLRGALLERDVVGRLGGDEFVVISPGLTSAEATVAFADGIAQQLQGPATFGSVTVSIFASIGVAWTSSSTASELLSAADTAMYAAKKAKSTVPVLSPA